MPSVFSNKVIITKYRFLFLRALNPKMVVFTGYLFSSSEFNRFSFCPVGTWRSAAEHRAGETCQLCQPGTGGVVTSAYKLDRRNSRYRITPYDVETTPKKRNSGRRQ